MNAGATTSARLLDAVVIGGGLSGLRAAIELQRAGLEWQLVEAATTLGGRVRTEVVHGYLCDRGFQVHLDSYPEAAEFFSGSRLKFGRFRAGANIWFRGKWHAVADPLRDPARVLPTLLAPIGSLADKLRILRLQLFLGTPWCPRPNPRETTQDYLHRVGFSSQMIDRFFRPFYGGILLDRSLRADARFFVETFLFFAKGSACLPQDGMAALPATLAADLPAGRIQTNWPVAEIRPNPNGHGWEILSSRPELSPLFSPTVVLAVDRPTAARLLRAIAPDHCPPESDPADVGVTCLYFASSKSLPLPRHIHLNAEPADGPIHTLAEVSAVQPAYASGTGGKALLSASVLDDATRDKPAGWDLLDSATRQLSRWLGSNPTAELELIRTQRIHFAQPAQPDLSPADRVAEVAPGLFLAGDHTTIASINGALKSGRIAAEMAIPSIAKGRQKAP